MKNSKFNDIREMVLFGNADFLDFYEDPDQQFDSFCYEIYGSAAGSVLSSIYSQDQQ